MTQRRRGRTAESQQREGSPALHNASAYGHREAATRDEQCEAKTREDDPFYVVVRVLPNLRTSNHGVNGVYDTDLSWRGPDQPERRWRSSRRTAASRVAVLMRSSPNRPDKPLAPPAQTVATTTRCR
jgi:hypothetical protein